MDRDQEGASGVSRRSFIKAVSTTALVAPAFAQDSPDIVAPIARSGLKEYSFKGTTIALKVNGAEQKLSITPSTTLLEALREKLNLTGCKEVCDRGACGACTVMMNGRSINSCLTLAIDAIGSDITTVEGLAKGEKLDPVQKAFADCDACQCGYCIPGFVVRSRAFLNENPKPSADDIRKGLSGNICRCAAYVRIFQAVASVSTAANAGKGGAA